MRILIYGLNYAPELTGVGKYTGEMAEWLCGRGHDVRVVTAPPYYPAWRVSRPYKSWIYRKERLGSVKVWRCPLWVPRRLSGLIRILHIASFVLSSFPVMLCHMRWQPDVIISIEPTLLCAPFGLWAGRLAKAGTWLHIQDFEIDAAFSLGLLVGGELRTFVESLEVQLMNRFDRVSTISKRMIQKLETKGVKKERLGLFPNWVDTKQIYPLEQGSPMRHILGIPSETIVALYSGNIGEKQGLEIIIETAKRLKNYKNFLFIMCGDGAAAARLRRQASGQRNILWIPLQPMDQLNALLNVADIHLLPQRADAEDLVMPSKLTGMLASGRPIVATAYPGTEIWKAVQGRGIAVSPGDIKGFVQAIQTLSEKPEKRFELGFAARRFAVQNLEKEMVLCNFEEQFFELLKGKS